LQLFPLFLTHIAVFSLVLNFFDFFRGVEQDF
jgi:hypothetical protein